MHTLAALRFAILTGVMICATSVNAQNCWEHVPSPAPGNLTNILYGIDGVAPDDLWAVGRSDVGPGYPNPPDEYQTLAMHFDGKAWTHVPTPNSGAYFNDLLEVRAFASNDVWAAGNGSASELSQMLVMHWNGAQWNVVPTPTFTLGAVAWSMDGFSSNELWIVGSGNGANPLALRWNGSNWINPPAPPAGSYSNHLYGVDVVASNNVWAVGTWRNTTTNFRRLIMRFNGTAWAIDLASFAGPDTPSTLRGIAAVAANDIWAVGDHSVSGEGTQPLIMHFNGSIWSQHALPIFPEGVAELRDVTVRGPGDIWAAGTHATDAGIPRPLIMHYDGVEWSVVENVVSGGSHEWFRDITAIPGGDLWAVGQFTWGGSGTTTLTMRRSATPQIPGDITGDGAVNVNDLLAVINNWGPCPRQGPCPADIAPPPTGDGVVGVNDLLMVINNWT